MTRTSLAFVDNRDELVTAVAAALGVRPRRVVLRAALTADVAHDILAVTRLHGVPAGFDPRDRPPGDGVGVSPEIPTIDAQAPSDDDLVVVVDSHGGAVAAILMDYVDRFGVEILAIKTDRHFSRRPLLFTSIPKSGTHLALGLLARFGYALHHDAQRKPNVARGFANDIMRDRTLGAHLLETFGPQAPPLAGGTVHAIGEPSFHMPFLRVFELLSEMGVRRTQLTELPILFSYRHPLGVLVSESSAYADPVNHILGHYFASFGTTDERCHDLIRGNGLTSLVDRLASYVGWLRMPNVIPVSFEELVGPRGGGDATLQRQLIWSLQLKLQIPGDPAAFAETAHDPASRTFRRGRVDAFTDELSDHRTFLRQYPRLQQLCRDFDFDPDGADQPPRPRSHAERRCRRLIAAAPSVVATFGASAIWNGGRTTLALPAACASICRHAVPESPGFASWKDVLRIAADLPAARADVRRDSVQARHAAVRHLGTFWYFSIVADGGHYAAFVRDEAHEHETFPCAGRLLREADLPALISSIYDEIRGFAQAGPLVVFDTRDANLVLFRASAYLIPRKLGPVEIHPDERVDHPKVRRFEERAFARYFFEREAAGHVARIAAAVPSRDGAVVRLTGSPEKILRTR